jgi:LacI family transcriptional regulator
MRFASTDSIIGANCYGIYNQKAGIVHPISKCKLNQDAAILLPRSEMKKAPRVALLVETSNAYARGLLAGIAEFVRDHGPWSVALPEMGRANTISGLLRGWKGDGIIVRAERPHMAKALSACKCPIVDLSAAGLLAHSPAVHSNVYAEATAAFEHLWDRGFRNLGFCGVTNYQWVRWQHEQFIKLANAAGITIDNHIEAIRPAGAAGWNADRRSLIKWLTKIRKPAGIFACYDLRGQQVLDACAHAGLRVPDEISVIGVDNDTVRCSLSDPPLSSVEPDTLGVGYLAAELLANSMSGKKVSPGLRLVPPLGVRARRSTDALAVDDAEIATALRFIRAHACEPINVQTILDQVPMSRRSLESRFLKCVGRTPHAEILRCRVERATQLLRDTDVPIKSIARQVGVETPEYLSVLFKRSVGKSPSAYRTDHQNRH